MKYLTRFLFFSIIILILTTVIGFYYLKRQLPLTGTLQVAGLQAPVTLTQEPSGVMHIKAENSRDMWFGQGFVHARDRLWQLEMNRRTSSGRLAELFGETALDKDKLLRTWGFQRDAQHTYQHLSPEAQTAVQAYVDGINAFLAADPPLSPEFHLFQLTPEPWTVTDILAWQKVMAFYLAANRHAELLRYRLMANGLSAERALKIVSLYPDHAINTPEGRLAVPTTEAADAAQAEQLLNLLAEVTPLGTSASNNWVLQGTRTETGKPFLANDPHLKISTPATWYLNHLQGGEYDVIGASMVGLPAIVVGHNQSIAWGVTNAEADVEDVYQLEPTPNGDGYLYQGQVTAYQTRTETIKIKGAEPYTLTIRESVYGPVISDVVNVPAAKPLTLKWVGHNVNDTTIDAFLRINRAQNWQEFRQALLDYYIAPSQNFVYADTAGNIGYQLSGRIPIRVAGHSGTLPQAGTGEWDWQGFIPMAELVSFYNPAQGYLFTANHKVTPDDYPYNVSQDWGRDPYRARRLNELLSPLTQANIADMEKIQLDTVSLLFRDFKPLLQQLTPSTAAAQHALQQLLAWDGNMQLGSRESTLFNTWYVAFSTLPAPETGIEYWQHYPRYLFEALRDGDSACDARGMTCTEFATQQLEKVVADLGEQVLMWGEIHIGVFEHAPLSESPLAWLTERRIALAGGRYTLNVGWFSPENFSVYQAPAYRQIIDLADFNRSRFMLAPGQSGHWFDLHYDSLLILWRDGRYLPMLTTDYPIQQSLQLQPLD